MYLIMTLPKTSVHVFRHIARMKAEGRPDPTVSQICFHTGSSRRAVFYSLERLADEGLLVIEGKGRGTPNTYEVTEQGWTFHNSLNTRYTLIS